MQSAIFMSVRAAMLATLIGAVGCAAPPAKVRVDAIESALPRCQTFAWNPVAVGDAASFTDQRVRHAVMQTLQAKGYSESADKPDCRIAYQLRHGEAQAPAKPQVGVGVGGGSGGVGGGIGVSLPIGKKKGQGGTFTLDVIDAVKNAQVWSGSLDAEFSSAELSDAETKAVVEEILAEFPNRQ